MRLSRVYLQNLRNHRSTEVLPAEKVNILTGLNGAGKTSILEAISLCTLARSFVANQDSALLRRGAEELACRVEGKSDYGGPRKVDVHYSQEGGKRISLDGGGHASAARVIGSIPTVVLFPDLKAITGGPPLFRRRFLDLVLSQSKRTYLEDLLTYRRLLKQRNALLGKYRRTGRTIEPGLLEPWDEGMIERGARIMEVRTTFLREFAPLLSSTAAEVAFGSESVSLEYLPDGIDGSVQGLNEFRDALWLRSKEVRHKEVRRGTTLFGPHRDDVGMELNGGDVRTAASQGQHKTLLISLKVAEFHYLAEQTAETPVILLDDIFGDLDPKRAERVYDICRGLAQVFITAVSIDMLGFLRRRKLGSDDLHLEIAAGAVSGERAGSDVSDEESSTALNVAEDENSMEEE